MHNTQFERTELFDCNIFPLVTSPHCTLVMSRLFNAGCTKRLLTRILLCLLDLLTVSFITVKSLRKSVRFCSLNKAIVAAAR